MFIDDRNILQLATLQVKVHVRGAQMADPDMSERAALFRRAANVLARLEDAVVSGLDRDFPLYQGPRGPRQIWEITGGEVLRGLLDPAK